MSSKIPTRRGRRQIVQEEEKEEKEEEEEEEVAHPNEFEQFREMDADSSLSLSDGEILFE